MGARRARIVAGALSFVAITAGAGCSSPPEDESENIGRSQAPLTAYCQANVKGIGLVDTETKYLPNVVHCENGGAPFEALKAQAIAARSYLYYKMETAGAIADGTGDQVYSCGSSANAEQIKAVAETAGRVLRYKGITVCAFFVAGGAAAPPGCIGSSAASTEKYVTYNEGKSGTGITQTLLGWVSPTNYRNRGCLSQLGSRCLDGEGKKADDIIRFYYGEDIVIETATGPCVPSTTPDAGVDSALPDTSPRDSGAPDAPSDVDSSVSDAKDAIASDGAPSDDIGGDVEGSCACSVPGDPRATDRAFVLALVAAAGLLARRRRVTG